MTKSNFKENEGNHNSYIGKLGEEMFVKEFGEYIDLEKTKEYKENYSTEYPPIDFFMINGDTVDVKNKSSEEFHIEILNGYGVGGWVHHEQVKYIIIRFYDTNQWYILTRRKMKNLALKFTNNTEPVCPPELHKVFQRKKGCNGNTKDSIAKTVVVNKYDLFNAGMKPIQESISLT